jgi:ribosomal protein S18 acetylase RimI-like enzyme
MNHPEPNRIEPLRQIHCHNVARLHREGIASGFISSLGQKFVESLYGAIAEDNNSFGFVAVQNDIPVGFIAFTANLLNLYKHVALKQGLKFAPIMFRRVFSLRVIKKVYDNLIYPSKMKRMELPDAELLSIAVAVEGRGKGIAMSLIHAGLEEYRKRRVEKVKVLVAEDNVPANTLYRKAGFHLACQINSHGVLSNIYVISPMDHPRQP